MEGDKISTIAELLRKSGEIILQGDETLFLNDTLLKNINDSFTFLTEEDGDMLFQVTHSDNSDDELFRDVQFLHDFLQKVLKLSIVEDTSSHNRVPVKINKFRSLRVLELKKVPVNSVYGIQRLRSQLNCVKCVYCLQQLRQLLIMCGADKSSPHVWEGLTEGVFTHNGFDSIDSSFEYTPWLQKIDLSYNNLKSFSVLFSLPNLKYLNLSYNLLESAPVVSREASNKLETLIVKNNYIKDISALSNYENLVELDLSCNCLTGHSALIPLHNLSSLRTLNLIGNPLSFHKQHRFNTVYHLHRNTVNYKFYLDQKALSWRERRRIPKERVEDLQSLGSANSVDGNSTRVLSLSEPIGTASVAVAAAQDVPPKHNYESRKNTRQRRQVTEAVIAEYSKEDEEEKTDVILETSNDEHLKVKRRVQELREQFGRENWLVQRAACHLQAALSLPRHSPPSLEQLVAQAAAAPQGDLLVEGSVARGAATEAAVEAPPPPPPPPIDGEAATSEDAHSEKSEESVEEAMKEEEEENALEELQEFEEGRVFAARLLGGGREPPREVLLCAGERCLQERDAQSGRARTRWALPGPLRSCELLPASATTPDAAAAGAAGAAGAAALALRLSFDALRRDARSRTYLMDAPDAQTLVRFIDNILASRSLADMNQVPYKCMKCSTQFCREENFLYSTKGGTVLCPNCNSNIVCVMSESELPQPSVMETQSIDKSSATPEIHRNLGSNKSSPQYSIGSGASLEGEGDSVIGVASVGSGTTSTTTTAAASDASGRGRGDSDVEVLSSTSSIEVLVEGESRTTPSRDSCSQDLSEGRVQSNLNKAAVPVSLTESSSSGSLTESICTTYETSNSAGDGSGSDGMDGLSAQQNNDKNWPSQELLEKAMEDAPLYRFEPIPSIQEMFEGLLESVDKKLSTKADDISLGGENDFIQYSYTDFSHADHRLHLYFLQELFQAEDEKLLLVLRAEVLNMGLKKTFPSLLVVSSHHVWLLRVIGTEKDTVAEWLRSQAQWPLHALCRAFVLPWSQGVGIGLQGAREVEAVTGSNEGENTQHMLFFLQDPARSEAFLHAAEAVLPKSCKILFEVDDYQTQRLRLLEESNDASSEDGSPIQFVGVFSSFSISDKKDCGVNYGVIAVRMRDILITDSNLCWFSPVVSKDEDIKVVTAQKICNLLEVETNKSSVSLNFVDETNQSQEIWHLTFETLVCVKSVVGAIQSPWEDIFSVSLQVRDVSRQ